MIGKQYSSHVDCFNLTISYSSSFQVDCKIASLSYSTLFAVIKYLRQQISRVFSNYNNTSNSATENPNSFPGAEFFRNWQSPGQEVVGLSRDLKVHDPLFTITDAGLCPEHKKGLNKPANSYHVSSRIYFNIICPSTLRSCKRSLQFKISNQKMYVFLYSSLCATCPVLLYPAFQDFRKLIGTNEFN
jgi:hypothetical protein